MNLANIAPPFMSWNRLQEVDMTTNTNQAHIFSSRSRWGITAGVRHWNNGILGFLSVYCKGTSSRTSGYSAGLLGWCANSTSDNIRKISKWEFPRFPGHCGELREITVGCGELQGIPMNATGNFKRWRIQGRVLKFGNRLGLTWGKGDGACVGNFPVTLTMDVVVARN